MPDEPEIDTDRLREAVHEEMDKENDSKFLKGIALSTAILAAFAAVAALLAGGTVNRALIAKTEATISQAKASDQWTYYQAKGIKKNIAEEAANAWLAAGKTPPPRLAQEAERYKREQVVIDSQAKALEHERDKSSEDAELLLHTHHHYADSVALFQVSIALGAVAALSRSRIVWYGSMAVGLSGMALFFFTLLPALH